MVVETDARGRWTTHLTRPVDHPIIPHVHLESLNLLHFRFHSHKTGLAWYLVSSFPSSSLLRSSPQTILFLSVLRQCLRPRSPALAPSLLTEDRQARPLPRSVEASNQRHASLCSAAYLCLARRAGRGGNRQPPCHPHSSPVSNNTPASSELLFRAAYRLPVARATPRDQRNNQSVRTREPTKDAATVVHQYLGYFRAGIVAISFDRGYLAPDKESQSKEFTWNTIQSAGE